MLVLIQSIIAARVVLLPEPVGPVTSTRPLGRAESSRSTGGRLRSSRLAMVWGIRRSTIAGPRRVTIRLIRTRTNGKAWEPSNSRSRRKLSSSAAPSISRTQPMKAGWSVAGQPVRTMSPRWR